MLTRFGLIAFFAALMGSSCCAAEPDLDRATIYASWLGQWKGVLEYRAYQPPHGRVSLPTTLSVASSPGNTALIFQFVYDDGPKKTVKSTSRFEFDPKARRLTWTDDGKPATAQDKFTLAEASDSGDRLVFFGEAMDDNKPSRIRYTITTGPDTWRILKETTSDGPDFGFRHEYRFSR